MEKFQVPFLTPFLQKYGLGRGPNIFGVAKPPLFMTDNWYASTFPMRQEHSTGLFHLMWSSSTSSLAIKGIRELLKITIVSRKEWLVAKSWAAINEYLLRSILYIVNIF